nr:hypothetical protein [Tanacetum cinerariifolium]
MFYTSSYTKGWMSFVKRSDAAPVCYSKPLDSVKNRNAIFWVDSTAFPLSVSVKSKILSKDPPLKLSRFSSNYVCSKDLHPKSLEMEWEDKLEVFDCILNSLSLEEFDQVKVQLIDLGITSVYLLKIAKERMCFQSVNENERVLGDGFFAFIRHSDPTKVRIEERELAEREVELLKMTERRIVPLTPLTTTALEDSGDSIDKLFDDVDQERVVEKSDDVLEETIAKDTLEVVAEKAKKKRKRKVVGDASGSTYPPKKLRDGHQSLLPNTGGKSLAALCGMVSEGSAIPSGATKPLIAASMAPVSDVGPLDSMSGPNLRTCPPHVRYVISSDGSRHSGSYSETNSFVRSPAADASVVTVAVTTTVDFDVGVGSKAKDVSKDFENIGDSTSAGGVNADAAIISRLKKTSTSSDSFYASQSLDTETMHRVYVPRWKVTNNSILDDPYVCRDLTDRLAPPALFAQLRAMDYDQLYYRIQRWCRTTGLSWSRGEDAGGACFGEEKPTIRNRNCGCCQEYRAEGLKEKKFALEGERGALSERVTTFESVTISKEAELASLSSQVAKLTADLSGFQLLCDELSFKVASLESERECLAAQVSLESAFEHFRKRIEALQDKQVKDLGERVAELDVQLSEMAIHLDEEFYPYFLTTIFGRRWFLSHGLKLVILKCLKSPEYLQALGRAIGCAVNKGIQDGLKAGIDHGKVGRDLSVDSSIVNLMDSLLLKGVLAEIPGAENLHPSSKQLMLPIYRPKDNVVFAETSLSSSLEIVNLRVQRSREEPKEKRLSLMDVMTPFVEPLSSKSLTGEASASAAPSLPFQQHLPPLPSSLLTQLSAIKFWMRSRMMKILLP